MKKVFVDEEALFFEKREDKLVLTNYLGRRWCNVDIDKEELINLYKEGWSILDLVNKYHIRKNKISKFIRESGIKVKRGIKGYKHRI